MARVFAAMSGGVDSSVTAALLLEQGHDVTGVTMQLWPSSDDAGGCCSVSAVRDARRVCDLLGIPHYALNYRERFEAEVVVPFAREYASGRTPNPCLVCNDRLKFSDLLGKVALQGAEYLATGHYARIGPGPNGDLRLLRGIDPGKDQSYFLYRLTPEQLAATLFPVGELTKPQVREMALRIGLHVAEKPDSQEICFAEAGEHAHVVARLHPEAVVHGAIELLDGTVVGRHRGIAHYTVGQRKGLGVSSADPLYVVAIDAARNVVTIGPKSALSAQTITALEPVWRAPHGVDVPVTAMVRYRMAPAPAVARCDGERLEVRFEAPLEGVAPGQAVVCYEGEVCIGGGTIECAS